MLEFWLWNRVLQIKRTLTRYLNTFVHLQSLCCSYHTHSGSSQLALICCSHFGELLQSHFPDFLLGFSLTKPLSSEPQVDPGKRKLACTRLAVAILTPFESIGQLFGKQARQRFERDLAGIGLTGSEPTDFADLLVQTLNKSVNLIHQAVQCCFDSTLGMGLPYLLSVIQFYWEALLAKWTIAMERSVEQLVSLDSRSGYSQASGFVSALQVASLTGELSLQADTFVEAILNRSTDYFSKILVNTDNCPLLASGVYPHDLFEHCLDSIGSSDWSLLCRLVDSQSAQCQSAIHSFAHPSVQASTGRFAELSTLDPKSGPDCQSNLTGLHRASVTACRTAVSLVRRVALAPLRHFLQPVPSLTVWFATPDSGEPTLPDLAYLPQDYITRIGQYLLALPEHLEPYMSVGLGYSEPERLKFVDTNLTSDQCSSRGLAECLHLGDVDAAAMSIAGNKCVISNEDSEVRSSRKLASPTEKPIGLDENAAAFCWLDSFISGAACDLLVNSLLHIGGVSSAPAKTALGTSRSSKPNGEAHESGSDMEDQQVLTEHGAKQLEADLSYLQNLLEDLGLSFPGTLKALRELINCPPDQFANMSADRPPRIVNAVARLRGF
ncbi:hypothetical protein EG68_10661 [Paragonimus skrjabini miyazakii]|uniref:Conserved oligomeric Golgi complex subunit 7 n=1 Tax=Paragonimus skrjabini miyazakii TaxID=59628 RepID=A0A8S9Y8K5_9TREM|nr:hypothetical protein EG68_10661 [Paragonimus skrjabini miyazakii]